jgi:hypothetical protein
MANKKHLEILKQGVSAWNEWRQQHRASGPDPSDADLTKANLAGADLAGVHLASANLRGANLRGAILAGSRLSESDLGRADLNGANLVGADLRDAHLGGAHLVGADLVGADLNRADLNRVDLNGAHLGGADLSRSNLNDADLSRAVFANTVLADVDLSEARGLDVARHVAPSSIGLDTIYKSHGRIPDKFLRDAGVPEEIIEIVRSIRSGPPIQWHSCFISYSTKDEEFAHRLHARMREANMRVWFAPEDMEGGKKLHEQLFQAIQLQDKLLLVLSPHSIQSEWVMTEIRRAREVEKRENRRKLFPIRLVDFDALRAWACFDADTGKDLAVEVREYFIPDFSNWKDHDAFEAAFARLQKDLKTGQPLTISS